MLYSFFFFIVRALRLFLGFLSFVAFFGIYIEIDKLGGLPKIINNFSIFMSTYSFATLLSFPLMTIVFVSAYFILGRCLNQSYLNKYGFPHPKLSKDKWSI